MPYGTRVNLQDNETIDANIAEIIEHWDEFEHIKTKKMPCGSGMISKHEAAELLRAKENVTVHCPCGNPKHILFQINIVKEGQNVK